MSSAAVEIALIGAAVVFAAAVALGVRCLPVLTGSMTPFAPVGTMAVTVPVDGTAVRVGQVVAFRPPAPYTIIGRRPVLHRVVELGTTGGRPWMRTKGDANPGADPWRVSLRDADLGRVVMAVPVAGRLFAGGRWGAVAVLAGVGVLALGLGGLREPRTSERRVLALHPRGHHMRGRC